jgi:chromosome segregation ATPase
MIFKPRPNSPEEMSQTDGDPKEDQPVDATTQVHDRTDDVSSDVLDAAFGAVAQVVRAEMQSVTRSIKELETKMIRRLQTEKESMNASLNDLRKDMMGRLEQVGRRADDATAEVEKTIDAKQEKLEHDMDALMDDLSAVRDDLERQIDSAGRVSSLLNNMAGVFSDRSTLPEEPRPEAHPTPEPHDA